jgi:uncharacterized protein (TIGR04141 family)
MRSNKLTIYLVKKEYVNFEDIVQNSEQSFKDLDKYRFYYDESDIKMPSWIKDFFGNSLDDLDVIQSASSKGLLLLKVEVENDNERIFVISFGHGRHLVNNDCFEERFGLKTTLNVISENTIRQITKKDISSVPKHSIEQRAKVGSHVDFGINSEQEILNGIWGDVKKEYVEIFGKNLSGSLSLVVNGKFAITNIEDLLKKCYERYISEDYKKGFGWIDNISPIKNKGDIKSLNKQLIKNLREETISCPIWMSIPEIIDSSRLDGFSYNDSREIYPNINLREFLYEINRRRSDLEIEDFEKNKISMVNTDEVETEHWKAYRCLYAEIERDKKIYLLNGGEWFEVNMDFSKEIKDFYDSMIKKTNSLKLVDLPACSFNKEREYNEYVSKKGNFILMDNKLISHGGGYSKIEFCDLLSKDKNIIHVKNYGGSSTLSHLFHQGSVSAILAKKDNDFIKKVNEKINETLPEYKIEEPFSPFGYKIIFAVISGRGDLILPLFSKIALKNTEKELNSLGYEVFLVKIPKQVN